MGEVAKIVTVVGGRPQFVKAAMVSRAFRAQGLVREVLVHTGQHYDREMSQIFFEELELPTPAYHLGVGSGSHAIQTGEIMRRLEEVLLREKPHRVLIYGDMNSTLAAALTAAKLTLPVDHVEAGIRSFNRTMPEEINRLVADHLSSQLFCPTRTAVINLAQEGIRGGVHETGDVMYDAMLLFNRQSSSQARCLEHRSLSPREYLLLTLHRAENTDDEQKLGRFLAGLQEVNFPILFPVHPRTANIMEKAGLALPSNVRAIPPVSYLEMLQLEKHALAILTDSGGMQKESYWFRVPCLTLRQDTEWPETVEAGWNRLVGLDPEMLLRGLEHHRNGATRTDCDCFGDGRAAERIVQILFETVDR